MKVILRLTALLIWLLLASCSMLQPQGDALERRINTLVAEHRYGRAQDLLATIPRDSPDYNRFANRRKQVNILAAQYERKVIDDARQLMIRERWADALNLYDTALANMPRSRKLQEGLDDLLRLQQQRVARHESELLLNRGEELLDALPTYQNLAQTDPRDYRRERDYQSKLDEAEDITNDMVEAADDAIGLRDFEQAERLLTLAAKLSKKQNVRKAQARFDQARAKHARDLHKRQEQRQREEALQDRDRSETLVQLQQDYDAAIEAHDYLTARFLLPKLKSYDPDIVAQRGYESQLKKLIEVEGERLYEEGVAHYGHSEFEKARDSWEKTLALLPNHARAKESLARVNKVLGKIDHLRKKQKGEL